MVLWYTGRGYLVLMVPLLVWAAIQFGTTQAFGNENYWKEHSWPGALALGLSGITLTSWGACGAEAGPSA
jgi:hypothetical protein